MTLSAAEYSVLLSLFHVQHWRAKALASATRTHNHFASDALTISASFRRMIDLFAKAGCDQTTCRCWAAPVGSSRWVRLSS